MYMQIANNLKIGKGTWIFNKKLLMERDYISNIEKIIANYSQSFGQNENSFSKCKISL